MLEARACRVLVVCSNTTSLPEVAGDAALLVGPTDVRTLAGAMEQALTNNTLRTALQVRGLKWAQRFSWEDAAGRLWKFTSE